MHNIYKHTVKLIKYFINLTVWQIYFINILQLIVNYLVEY